MADDTRDQSANKAFAGNQWAEAQPPKAPENANLLAAGASTNTAGGGQSAADVTLVDAAKTISADDWTKFPKKPCVRDSFLTGMTAGFAVGSTRAIWRSPIQVACNWAVGTFCFSSVAMYWYCQRQRELEKAGMKRAIEIIDRKQLERKQKEARLERIREQRRQKKEEELDKSFAKLNDGDQQQSKSSWKFW